jgi:hypothetical protein
MQTVVETPSFFKAAGNLFSTEEREAIVATVAADPECGDLIQGTGDFRKLRVGRDGMGKSAALASSTSSATKTSLFFSSRPTRRTKRKI